MHLQIGILFVWLYIASAFESGKEYQYSYSGFALNRLGGSKQFSGTAFLGTLAIQKQNNDRYAFKVNDMRFDLVNKEIQGNVDKYQFDYKEVPQYIAEIGKTFTAVIRNGQVQSYKISNNEPIWSKDIKQGFLNFFELNFDHSNSNHSHAVSDEQFYSINERGTFGVCETAYRIRSVVPETFNVTKTRNYEKCTKHDHPPLFSYPKGFKCSQDPNARQPVSQPASVYEYHMIGTKDDYVFETVEHKEYIQHSPFGNDGRKLSLYSRRGLTLSSTNDIGQQLQVEGESTTYTDLTFSSFKKVEFFGNVNLQDAHYLGDLFQYEYPTAQIVELLDEASSDLIGYQFGAEYSSILAKYGIIIDALATLNYTQLEQVLQGVSQSNKEKSKELFFELLPLVGTNPSFLLTKRLLLEDAQVKRPETLQKLAVHIKEPTEALFNEFLDLCKHNLIKEEFNAKKACYLGFSSLVNAECVTEYNVRRAHHHKIQHHSQHTKHCSPDVAARYFRLMIPTQEPQGADQLLYIKTAGNFGIRDSIAYLNKYIQSPGKHYLRATAAFELAGCARNNREDVRAIAVPLYFNVSEEVDIRLAGFIAWFESGIGLSQLQMIAWELFREPNRQIVSFVHSTVKSLAEEKNPCLTERSRDARYMLQIFDKVKQTLGFPFLNRWDSFNSINGGYDEKYGIGVLSQFSVIISNRSYVPYGLYMRDASFVAGKIYPGDEVSIQNYGVERLINRLFGKRGSYWKASSFFDLFKKRILRNVDTVDQEVKEIERNLPTVNRNYEELKIIFSISHNGRTKEYYEIGESDVAEILSNGTFNIPEPLKQLLGVDLSADRKSRSFTQTRNILRLFRNEMGLRSFFSVRSYGLKTLYANKFQMNVLPALFSEDRGGQPPTEVSLSTAFKFIKHSDHYITLGVIYASKSIGGAGVRRTTIMTLPFDMDFIYKRAEKKLLIKRRPIVDDIYFDRVTPFTFVDNLINKVPLPQEPKYYPIPYDSRNFKNFDFSLLKNYLGFGVRVTGYTKKNYDIKEKLMKLMMDENFLDKILSHYKYHPSGNPYEIRERLELDSQNPATELIATWSRDYDDDESNTIPESADDEFTRYTSRSDRKPENHALRLQLFSNGTTLQRTIVAQLKYAHSRDDLLHKVHFNYARSPNGDNGFKFCFNSLMKFPEIDADKYFTMNMQNVDERVNLSATIEFGRDCQNGAKIRLMSTMDKTDEQRLLESTRDRPLTQEHVNLYASEYQMCLNDSPYDYSQLPYCPWYSYHASQLRKLHAHIIYENVPQTFINMTNKYIQLANHVRFAYLDINYGANNPANTIHFESNSSVLGEKADYKLYTPTFTAFYKNVPIKGFEDFPPVSNFPLVSYIEDWRDERKYPFCFVQSAITRTFDNITFPTTLLQDGCRHLLVKDCSDEHVFQILLEKENGGFTVTAYIGHKFKVEIKRTSESTAEVRVNGAPVAVSRTEAYYHNYEAAGREFEVFAVFFNGKFYTIESKNVGFILLTDATSILVDVSKYYWGKLCGICGDCNGESVNELSGANGCLYKSAADFVNSYVVPSSSCTAPLVANCNA